jgi:heme-degrading monooxygenase HmoA
MIVEHAEFTIRPDQAAEFEAAVERGRAALGAAPGFRWARLIRQVENPSVYLLLVGWEKLEDHTVGFRESELFGQWRAQVGPFFATTPVVVHYEGEPSIGPVE